MSLVTRCPACATAFKVVRDQLRLSEGWVRCGRCSQVFDATLDLQNSDEGEPSASAAPATAAVAPPPAESSPSIAAAASPVDTPPVAGTLPPYDEDDFVEPDELPVAAAPATAWPAPELLDLGAPAEPVPSPATDPPMESAASVPRAAAAPATTDALAVPPASGWSPLPTDLPAVVADEPWPLAAASRSSDGDDAPPSPVDEAVNAQLQKALRRTRIQALRESRARERAEARSDGEVAPAPRWKPEAQAPSPAPAPVSIAPAPVALPEVTLRQASDDAPPAAEAIDPAPAPALPSFLEAPAPVEAPRPRHRAALLSLGVLAVLALMLQVLRHERDGLAASQPALRPVLATLCQWSGCELSPVRRIDAIRIDGSSFTPERDAGGYRLLFSLRNASPTALAMPAIELSLLDGNERPVVRRVFQPREFGAPAVLGPRAEHAATLPLTLKLPEGGGVPPVVGYSLLAFYP